jgi:hypothetical protein
LDHSGKLDAALQLEPTPGPARTRVAQRGDQLVRLSAQKFVRLPDIPDLRQNGRVCVLALQFQCVCFISQLFQGGLHGLQQVFDRLLAHLKFGLRFLLLFSQLFFCQFDKDAVVLMQCVRGQSGECVFKRLLILCPLFRQGGESIHLGLQLALARGKPFMG